MKKLIVLTVVMAIVAMSCTRTAPIENTTPKQGVWIRVQNVETNVYSYPTFIKL